MKKILSLLLIVATFLFVAFSHAQGNLIVNGGFDTTNNWILSPSAYFNVKNGQPAPDIVLEGRSASSTEPIGLSQNTTYLISGDYRPIQIDYGDLRVGFNSGIVYELTLSVGRGSWSSFSFQYKAPSSISSISISFKGVGICEIDNISVCAIPEPSVGLFLLAVLFVLMLGLAAFPSRNRVQQ